MALQGGHPAFLMCLTAAVCCAEDAHGNLRVLLPAALLANCHQPVAHDLLPVIASQLQQVLQQPDWNRSSWPVMEWLFQDVYLAKLAKCFREASTATLKVRRVVRRVAVAALGALTLAYHAAGSAAGHSAK